MMKTTFSLMATFLLSGCIITSFAQKIVSPIEEHVRLEKEPTKPLAARSRRQSKKKIYMPLPGGNGAYDDDAAVTLFGTQTANIRRQLKAKSAKSTTYALPSVPIYTYPTYRPPTYAKLSKSKGKSKSKQVPTDALIPTPMYEPIPAPTVPVGITPAPTIPPIGIPPVGRGSNPRETPPMRSWTEPDFP
mmetsp:Transcript_23793/g.47296  ORF Transcript_23793/g.47296 Transcript_23793/m.47296 type:complete len:189 (+) Transcript_23793:179-745(+)